MIAIRNFLGLHVVVVKLFSYNVLIVKHLLLSFFLEIIIRVLHAIFFNYINNKKQ